MYGVIKKLKQQIESTELIVIEEWDDGFTYAVAVQHEKGIFIIYTTKSIYHYRNNDCAFRLLQASEHLPFEDVTPWPGGDFISPYTIALTHGGKCVANYGRNYSVDEFPQILEHAADPF